ncbi:MAG: YidC/Oxa1 family membrane protein insertase, partial [Gammaproteobacteria bacterium]|nr:YidC/Oxa1 family membrane protein insertase [Gammaproteobacteria bacterium]
MSRFIGTIATGLIAPMLSMLFYVLPISAAYAEIHHLKVGSQELSFSTQGGLIVSWKTCYPDCQSNSAVKAQWFDADDGFLRWSVPDSPMLTSRLQASVFDFEFVDSSEYVRVVARSREKFTNKHLEYVYQLPKQGYRGQITANGIDGLTLTFASGNSFVPEQLPGFGSIYSKVQPVTLDYDHFSYLEPEGTEFDVMDLHVVSSIGLRNRYWLWLLAPHAQTVGEFAVAAPNRPIVAVRAPSSGKEVVLDIYTGPTEIDSLLQANPLLKGVLFSALWDWLRLISFGMLYLLNWLYGIVGNYGVAIILLSLSVKVLMFPLTHIADKWQAQVNATSRMLKPKLNEIKRAYKGEEAHNKILAVYKDHDISQFYTLRSLFGFLIQIPIFIAAFDMLAENFVLGQASFLWIEDLAKPDNF